MAQDSKIEWCHHTANLWWGCEHVHAGCDNCYAEAWANWKAKPTLWGRDTSRMEIKGVWSDLAKFQRMAAAAGEVHRVFVGSMMDIFEKPKPIINREGVHAVDCADGSYIETDFLRDRLFTEVIPASPNLLFLLLTKRPSNINKYIPQHWKQEPPANVMFGTSIVNMGTMSTLIPQLLQVNGRRFLSIEPQIGWIPRFTMEGIHWVIQGGESGPKRRPFDLSWARRMRDDCKEQNVPYFFKQIDKVQPIPADLQIREFPL